MSWAATCVPASLPALLTLTDFIWVGLAHPDAPLRLDAWGPPPLDGDLRLAWPVARPWEKLAGRVANGQLATRFVDMTLRVAETLENLDLPASLAAGALAPALVDLIHETPVGHADDCMRWRSTRPGCPTSDCSNTLRLSLPAARSSRPTPSNRIGRGHEDPHPPGRARGECGRRHRDVAGRGQDHGARSGSHVSGLLMVRADIRPPERSADVARVTFFVDGVELCADSSPPFECATRSRDLRGLLERMAAVSGGQALFADHRVGLSAAFSAIVEDLSHQYLIGYQPASQKRDGAWRKIRIEVDGPYRLRHRQGYRLLPEGRS